ncbi:hypothetical protein ACET3Z_030697 [Daucus carota]
MGQILDKFKGKEWRQKQVKKISDKFFDCLETETGKPSPTFEDLYIAVLLTFNELNKRLPGPHVDPPTKERVRDLMRECDMNLDQELDREEFEKFMTQLTAETVVIVSQGLIISLAVAPAMALLTKRATEGLPHVGKVVRKIPSSVYASLVTLAVVMFQKSMRSVE